MTTESITRVFKTYSFPFKRSPIKIEWWGDYSYTQSIKSTCRRLSFVFFRYSIDIWYDARRKKIDDGKRCIEMSITKENIGLVKDIFKIWI